jgi:hypothetical protein
MVKRATGRLILGLAVAISTAFAQAPASKSSTMILIDHASICGSDLQALQQALTDVGLKPDYGGPHSNGVTHMALLGFDDGSYIELIAPQKAGAVEGSNWAKFMAGDVGPCAWAVATGDIQPEVQRLRKLGIAVTEPQPGSRKRPDGMSIEWNTANVGPGTPGSTLPFIIEDRTPRAWRVQPSASVSGSLLLGVEVVVIGVNNLDASIAQFRRAYGWEAPLIESHGDFDAKLAYFPGAPVMLASPLGTHSWLTDRLERFGEAPVALLLGTRDLNAAAKRYHLSGGKSWFGQKVAWFDATKLHGVRLGVLGQ